MRAFKDLYDKEQYIVPILAPPSVKINGVDLRQFGFMLSEHPDIMFPEVRARHQAINMNPGLRNHGSSYGGHAFNLVGYIRGLSHQDAMKKWDRLKNWLDSENQSINTYLLNGDSVRGLVMEICHRYWYTDGTITGTSKTLTGTNTKWAQYVGIDSTLEITNHTQVYTVVNVTSDTSMEIIPALTASVSGASYRVERKRFLLCVQDGPGSIESFADHGFLSQSKVGSTVSHQSSGIWNISIPFQSTYPYWVGPTFINKQTNLVSGTLLELSGIGNMPVSPVYGVVGATNNVKIVACESAFHGDFDFNLKATDILNNVDIVPTTSGTITYDLINGDSGVFVDAETIAYTSLIGNPNQWGFVARIGPNFNADTASVDDKYVFDFFDGTNANAVKLFYDVSDDDWVMNIRSGSMDNFTLRSSTTQNFDSGNYLEISGWFHKDGRVDPKDGITYYGKLIVNGEIIGSITSAVTSPLVQLTKLLIGSLVDNAATPTSQLWFNGTIGEIAIFLIAPTDEELKKYWTQQIPLTNRNAITTTTTTLAADDLMTLETAHGGSLKYAISNGALSILDHEGNEAHLLGRNEKQLLYVTAGATIPEFYIIYAPAWL